jgi:Na+-translocating ferredoxin:NAD+ oxidoreductase subunit G
MMNKSNNKSGGIFQITVNLTIASLISGLVIACVYFITEPYAVKQRIRIKNMAMKELIVPATDFQLINAKDEWYEALNNGSRIGYIISSETKGYGGEIRLLVAVDNTEKIIGYKILSHNETPGLGDRADQPKFKNQFQGKKIENLEVVKNHEEGKIDAITGATITSTAVTKAVKECLIKLHDYIRE